MKKLLAVLLLIFSISASKGQEEKLKKTIDIKSMMYCLTNLKVKEIDNYLLADNYYKFNGSEKNQDTVALKYKRQSDPYAVFVLRFVGNKIIESVFYTDSDKEFAQIMSEAEENGFKYVNTITYDPGDVVTKYQIKNKYVLMLN